MVKKQWQGDAALRNYSLLVEGTQSEPRPESDIFYDQKGENTLYNLNFQCF